MNTLPDHPTASRWFYLNFIAQLNPLPRGTQPVPDPDRRIDLTDYRTIRNCLSVGPGSSDVCTCGPAGGDGDGTVTLQAFAQWQRCFSGAGMPIDTTGAPP